MTKTRGDARDTRAAEVDEEEAVLRRLQGEVTLARKGVELTRKETDELLHLAAEASLSEEDARADLDAAVHEVRELCASSNVEVPDGDGAGQSIEALLGLRTNAPVVAED